MTDKVQKIRKEVERLHGNPYYMMAVKDALAIIDSLQEEPVSEEWIKELTTKLDSMSKEDLKKVFDKYAIDFNEEPVSEDLERASERAAVEAFFVSPQWIAVGKELFKDGAKWQKEKDQKK